MVNSNCSVIIQLMLLWCTNGGFFFFFIGLFIWYIKLVVLWLYFQKKPFFFVHVLYKNVTSCPCNLRCPVSKMCVQLHSFQVLKVSGYIRIVYIYIPLCRTVLGCRKREPREGFFVSILNTLYLSRSAQHAQNHFIKWVAQKKPSLQKYLDWIMRFGLKCLLYI